MADKWIATLAISPNSGYLFAGTFGWGLFRSTEPVDKPIITAVTEDVSAQGLPAKFSLSQNYPNPFNPETTISFDLPKATNVTLSIYNVTGQKVTTLVSGQQEAGHYRVSWDGRDSKGQEVASGVYLYCLETPDRGFEETRRMALMK